MTDFIETDHDDVPGNGTDRPTDPVAFHESELLTALAATTPLEEHVRASLVDRAQQAHLLDLTYRTLTTPIGSLLLAATEVGIVRVAFDLEDHDAVLAFLSDRIGSRVLRSVGGGRTVLDEAARELDGYFEGARTRFDVPLDLRLSTGFRRAVLEHLPLIPSGSTETYTEVATAAGSPRAVRAVGSACATNPLPILVPCHRVVRSDGTFGGYLGGIEAKHWLLRHESAA